MDKWPREIQIPGWLAKEHFDSDLAQAECDAREAQFLWGAEEDGWQESLHSCAMRIWALYQVARQVNCMKSLARVHELHEDVDAMFWPNAIYQYAHLDDVLEDVPVESELPCLLLPKGM